jgi:cytochrome oxidase assembly protein ShyY1
LRIFVNHGFIKTSKKEAADTKEYQPAITDI